MKITIITGSARKRGTSALLAENFIEGATEAGHEVFRFDAAFKDVHGCLGCDTCRKTTNGCVFKDAMTELNPHLLEADAIVFVSPIYYFNVSAQLKAVIDRFYAHNAKLQKGKKAALLFTMADDTAVVAEGASAFFKHLCDYMEWENKGILAAPACWQREDIEKTDFPQRAYELGKGF